MGKHANPWKGAGQIESKTGSTRTEMSKSRERIQTAPHLVERNGESAHYHPSSSPFMSSTAAGFRRAELSLQILSFLEQVWIDAYRVKSQKTAV